MAKRKRKERKENVSGISTSTNMSYEKYLKMALSMLSPHLSVRTYKLAPASDYPMFERGRDLRVQVYWKKESKYEFIVEQTFFYQPNTNKEDREYMRGWADHKIKMFRDAIVRSPKKSKVVVKPPKRKTKTTVGSTQQKFEEMKKKK